MKRPYGLFILGLIFVCLVGNTAWGARTAVTSARVGHHGEATRFVLDLSEQSEFRIFTLENPYRVVIDMPTLDWRIGEKNLPISDGLIKRLRYGQFKPETSRIVLDIAVPARVANARVLPSSSGDSYRLVVDLQPLGGAKRIDTQPPPAPKQTATAAPQINDAPAAVNGKPNKQASVMGRIEPPPPRRPTDQRFVVVVDPGHGGGDPGAISPNGIYEKHITLETGLELKRQLEESGRYRAVLTRSTDRFISLKDRVEIARDAGADLFVSLHADSHENSRVGGASVYTLSDTASDAETAELAQRENKADIVEGVNLDGGYDEEVTKILISLVQQSTMNCSATFATLLVPEIGKESRLVGRTHRFAGFRVLKAPDVPSVLIELGYFSNPQDEKRLRSRDHRRRLMRRMVAAIDSYFSTQSC